MNLKPLVLLLGAALAAPFAGAENLSDVYRDALAFDAQYASARAVYQATRGEGCRRPARACCPT